MDPCVHVRLEGVLFGDHHIYGRDDVRFCTRTKAITSRWPDSRHRGVDLGFPQNR